MALNWHTSPAPAGTLDGTELASLDGTELAPLDGPELASLDDSELAPDTLDVELATLTPCSWLEERTLAP